MLVIDFVMLNDGEFVLFNDLFELYCARTKHDVTIENHLLSQTNHKLFAETSKRPAVDSSLFGDFLRSSRNFRGFLLALVLNFDFQD